MSHTNIMDVYSGWSTTINHNVYDLFCFVYGKLIIDVQWESSIEICVCSAVNIFIFHYWLPACLAYVFFDWQKFYFLF
jgi:hypothetical protein